MALKRIKILGIAGSVRKTSANKGLLRAGRNGNCEKESEFSDVDLEIAEIDQFPWVNPDLEVENKVPDCVKEFRQKVLETDGVLLAFPEYNYSVPPVLKNALDWASRPPNVWAGKAAALMSAAGGTGGSRAQYHVRQTGVFLDLHFINKPELFVKAHEPNIFNAHGDLLDSSTRVRLQQLLSSLRSFAITLKQSRDQ